MILNFTTNKNGADIKFVSFQYNEIQKVLKENELVYKSFDEHLTTVTTKNNEQCGSIFSHKYIIHVGETRRVGYKFITQDEYSMIPIEILEYIEQNELKGDIPNDDIYVWDNINTQIYRK